MSSKYQSSKSCLSYLSRPRLEEKLGKETKLLISNIRQWKALGKNDAENVINGSLKASSIKIPQAKTTWQDTARNVKTMRHENAAGGRKFLKDDCQLSRVRKRTKITY